MTSSIEQYKQDLKSLVELGDLMEASLELARRKAAGKLSKKYAKLTGQFESEYQRHCS